MSNLDLVGGLSRRGLIGVLGAIAASPAAFAAEPAGHGHAPSISPDAALDKLMAGNRRFVTGALARPNQGVARRAALTSGQQPFATILSCSDSRVPPELVFDEGLGDLFVIRVAGNVIDDPALASAEYSVIHLGAPLIMVLGHQRCGAVTATIEALDGHGSEEDRDTHIGALADRIAPAVREVPKGAPDRLDAAVVLNARRAAHELLAQSRPLRERVAAGRLRIVSARYSLDHGDVTLIRNAQA